MRDALRLSGAHFRYLRDSRPAFGIKAQLPWAGHESPTEHATNDRIIGAAFGTAVLGVDRPTRAIIS